MPFSFFKAVEDTVIETLHQGIYGWQVTDCTVTMTHSGYWPRQSHSHGVFDKSRSSTAGDFRNLTPLVLMSALKRAGTRVYEPMHRFHLDSRQTRSDRYLAVLARLRAETPTHESWLNQVELFLSIVSRRVLKHGEFASEDDLADRLISFIDNYNLSAKPFRWTYDGRPLQAA